MIFYSIRKNTFYCYNDRMQAHKLLGTEPIGGWLAVFVCVCVVHFNKFYKTQSPLVLNRSWGMLSVESLANLCMLSGKNL